MYVPCSGFFWEYHLLCGLTKVTQPDWVSFSSSVEGRGWNRWSQKILVCGRSCIAGRIRKIRLHSPGQIPEPPEASVFFCVTRDPFLPPRCYASPLTITRTLRRSTCSANSFIISLGVNSCGFGSKYPCVASGAHSTRGTKRVWDSLIPLSKHLKSVGRNRGDTHACTCRCVRVHGRAHNLQMIRLDCLHSSVLPAFPWRTHVMLWETAGMWKPKRHAICSQLWQPLAVWLWSGHLNPPSLAFLSSGSGQWQPPFVTAGRMEWKNECKVTSPVSGQGCWNPVFMCGEQVTQGYACLKKGSSRCRAKQTRRTLKILLNHLFQVQIPIFDLRIPENPG